MLTVPSETAGAQDYVRPAGWAGGWGRPARWSRSGRAAACSPTKPARARGEGPRWWPRRCPCPGGGGGRGGRERGKAKYRRVQAQKAGARLAAAVAHPRRLAGKGTSFARRVRADSHGAAPAQTKGARRRGLSQLPCGPPGCLISPGNFGTPEPGTRREGLRARRGEGGRRTPAREGSGGGREGHLAAGILRGRRMDSRTTSEHAPVPSPQEHGQPAATGSRPLARIPVRGRAAGDAATQKGSRGLHPSSGLGTPEGPRQARLGSDAGSLCSRDANMFINAMCVAFPPLTPLPTGRLRGPPMARFQIRVPAAIFCLI